MPRGSSVPATPYGQLRLDSSTEGCVRSVNQYRPCCAMPGHWESAICRNATDMITNVFACRHITPSSHAMGGSTSVKAVVVA